MDPTLFNLPNILTMSRILMIPLFIGAFYIDGHVSNWLSFAIFSLAGVTDFFDGYLARKFKQSSRLGQFMDPVADKLLIATALMMMVGFGRIEEYSILAAVIILCREILVSGLREFLAELKVSVPVTLLAKWKTTIQIFAIGFLLVGEASPEAINSILIGNICLWVAALLTLYTGFDYLKTGLKHMK